MAIKTSRARSTGATIALEDNRRGQMDPGDLPWITVCATHNAVMSHPTRQVAQSFMAVPEEWCEDCQAQYSTDGSGDWSDFS